MIDAVARRYASALADVAVEQKSTDRAKADLASFVEAFFSASDLRIFLESPAVSREMKQRVLDEIAKEMKLEPAVRNFILLVVDHRHTEALHDIQQAFEEELNARMGIAEAEVTLARTLNANEKEQLKAALERRTGKKIEARFKEDRGLLGGAVVRVGSTVYDGSVREQLARMREQLEAE